MIAISFCSDLFGETKGKTSHFVLNVVEFMWFNLKPIDCSIHVIFFLDI